MAKKTTRKNAEANAEAAQISTAQEEQAATVLPDVAPAPSGSEDSTEAPKGGKRKAAKGKPSKNVNERRVIAPKGTTKGTAKGSKKGEPTPASEVTITPEAPKRGRGRPRKDGLPPGSEVATVETLTPEEAARLTEIEAEAKTLENGFIRFSTLLLEVSERRLYRATHKSFAAYVEERFNIKGRLGWYNVAAAGVNRALTEQGVTNLPQNESQARPLAQLANEPEKLAKAWEVANDIARQEGIQEPTRAHSERAVARVQGKPEPTSEQTSAPSTLASTPAPSTPVQAAQATGAIPAGAAVTTEEVTDGDDIGLDTDPVDIEMRDDKWLAQFPLDSQLKGLAHKRFKAEALAYRWLASARRTFVRTVLTPLIKEAKRETGISELGPYLHRARYGLTAPAPDKWVICDRCKGTGQVPTIGGCTTCHKAGFIVPVK